jgi:hypothetical protein
VCILLFGSWMRVLRFEYGLRMGGIRMGCDVD